MQAGNQDGSDLVKPKSNDPDRGHEQMGYSGGGSDTVL